MTPVNEDTLPVLSLQCLQASQSVIGKSKLLRSKLLSAGSVFDTLITARFDVE